MSDLSRIALFMPKRTDDPHILALATSYLDLHHLVQDSRRLHRDCDDSWYSCPKAYGGCDDPRAGTECNCGADAWNERIDKALDFAAKGYTGVDKPSPTAEILARFMQSMDQACTCKLAGTCDICKATKWIVEGKK